jgi:hypothetical protein
MMGNYYFAFPNSLVLETHKLKEFVWVPKAGRADDEAGCPKLKPSDILQAFFERTYAGKEHASSA